MDKQTKEWVEALGTLRLAVARYDAGWRTDGTPDLTPEGMQFREDRFREALAAFLEADASARAEREEGG